MRSIVALFFLDRQSRVHIAGTDSFIDNVAGYKHLGTLSGANVSLAPDIRERGRRHASATRTYVREGGDTLAL